MDWESVSYITRSKSRRKILIALKNSKATPVVLSRNTSLDSSHVSRGLKELNEKNFIECLTKPNIHKGKIYSITKKGIEVLKVIEENNL